VALAEAVGAISEELPWAVRQISVVADSLARRRRQPPQTRQMVLVLRVLVRGAWA